MGRKSNFSEGQIIEAIREIEGGAKVTEVARRLGVSLHTMTRWCARFGGMTVSEAHDKRRLEDENGRLKKLVAQFALENDQRQLLLPPDDNYFCRLDVVLTAREKVRSRGLRTGAGAPRSSMVTDAQVKRLRKKLMEAKTMEAAAMVAGMSERSARTWKTGALPSQTEGGAGLEDAARSVRRGLDERRRAAPGGGRERDT